MAEIAVLRTHIVNYAKNREDLCGLPKGRILSEILRGA